MLDVTRKAKCMWKLETPELEYYTILALCGVVFIGCGVVLVRQVGRLWKGEI